MFLREIGTRIFKNKRHVGINLYPTSQCSTGCYHCIDNSDCKNPVHFNKELAQVIIKEARRQRWKLSLLMTGGGEPLMTENLLEITDAFGSYERFGLFGMITSGFTNSEQERKEQLETLLRRPYAKELCIDQSFSLYHPSFPERLANMARLMISLKHKSYFRIRACMSLDNCKRTQLEIEKVLKNLAKELEAKYVRLPLGWQKEDRRLFRIFENKDTDDSSAYRMHIEAFLTPQWHGIKTKEGGVAALTLPISFEQTGRGKTISERPFGNSVCSLNLLDVDETHVTIAPDGSVYPECSCAPDEHMRLGRIGEDSLVEIIRRKDIFSERITKAILADDRMCEWGTNEVCVLCKKIVAVRGIELK